MIDSQIDYILRDIKAITENVIIKFSVEANSLETVDSKREGDVFITAKMERDTFTSYRRYDRDILIKAGITDVELLEECYYDKYKIPSNKRDTILKYMRERVINEYEELNDYYRKYIGRPPLDTDEEDYIYLTKEQMEFYKIDEVRPIHDYPLEILIKLERQVIPDFIKLYPDREYLKHMGSKAVDLVRAREAKNFEIIFSDIMLDDVFLRNFFETYAFCREYFMSVIYNRSLSSRYNLYENFIGMHIMIMAIQRVIVNTIKLSIDRDFYDLNSIKKLFSCYGVPFFEDLPLDYQRAIVKNLNVLIRTKSTDKVLYDISNILMYERIKIFKYFLVRERILDENGDPVKFEKEVIDNTGNIVKVPDYEKMYDVYFQSTDIMEPNIILAMENAPNRNEYLEVTEDDMLWWDNEELQAELYGRDFNFIETKYLGINLMYNLTDLLYETVYFLNLLVDNKDTTTPMETRIFNSDAMKTGTDYLYLKLDRFSPIPISIFDSVVILCALVSKKNGMKGNIICSSPTQVLSVLGFNFEANFDLIRENIKKYPRIFKDQSIVKYLDLLDVKKVEDIETIYKNFKNFADFCADVISTTENIYEYKAYKQLYKAITVREETGEAFTMSNGKIAKTFLEYLYNKLPHIAEMIDDMHKDKLGVYIEHVIGRLNELIPDIEYLSSINGTNNNIVTALVSLINFFKSYTTDLRNLNVVYMLDDKVANKIRMVDDPRLFNKLYPVEKALKYNDLIITHSNFKHDDNLAVNFVNRVFNKLTNKDKFTYSEFMHVSKELDLIDNSKLAYSDLLNNIISNYDYDEIISFDDKYTVNNSLSPNDKYNTNDKIQSISSTIRTNDEMYLEYSDILFGKTVKCQYKEKLNIRDTIKIIYEE